MALFLLAGIGAVPTAAQSLSDARAAYERGDYDAAHRGFLGFAEQGDADAQFYLAQMYKNGQGVPQDYVEAVKWLRRSAEQGLAIAQLFLG